MSLPSSTQKIYSYQIPTYTFFYSPVLACAPLTYHDVLLFKQFVIKLSTREVSHLLVPEETYLVPGRMLFQLLEKQDAAYTSFLFEHVCKLAHLAHRLQEISFVDHRDGHITSLAAFYPEYERIFSPVLAMGYSLDIAIQEYLERNKIALEDIPPYRASFVQHEQEERMAAQRAETLDEHALRYNWLLNNYTGEHLVERSYFETKSDPLVTSLRQSREPLRMPTTILEWISFLIFVRDERKRCNLIAIGLMDRWLKDYCAKNKLDYAHAVLSTVHEIEQGIVHPVTERYLELLDGVMQEVPAPVWEEMYKQSHQHTLRRVLGTVACKGTVTGRAVVVFGPEQFSLVQEGDILVTSMTRPEFVPVLKRVKGIVTNEGGVTCHAAILSRELRIPCVIGTSHATDVIKTGDTVLIDGETGDVIILNTNTA